MFYDKFVLPSTISELRAMAKSGASPMPHDAISRSDAKEKIKARAKRYETASHQSFHHGVYQGLMVALNEVCALDNLPALDGGGKSTPADAGESSERTQYIASRPWRTKPMECLGGFGSVEEKEAWDAASDEAMRAALADAPPAEERRPAVEVTEKADTRNWRNLYRSLYCRIWLATEKEFDDDADSDEFDHIGTMSELLRMAYPRLSKEAAHQLTSGDAAKGTTGP